MSLQAPPIGTIADMTTEVFLLNEKREWRKGTRKGVRGRGGGAREEGRGRGGEGREERKDRKCSKTKVFPLYDKKREKGGMVRRRKWRRKRRRKRREGRGEGEGREGRKERT